METVLAVSDVHLAAGGGMRLVAQPPIGSPIFAIGFVVPWIVWLES
jgi:hypothetical protein